MVKVVWNATWDERGRHYIVAEMVEQIHWNVDFALANKVFCFESRNVFISYGWDIV
jgi:hypothetical protein